LSRTRYLATSPGGVDAAAIIAASTKVDTPFVMALADCQDDRAAARWPLYSAMDGEPRLSRQPRTPSQPRHWTKATESAGGRAASLLRSKT
jgi:hypothetical protein